MMREQTYLVFLLPLRLLTGWFLFQDGLGRLLGRYVEKQKLVSDLEGWLRDGRTYGFARGFFADTVLGHPQPFAWLLVIGLLVSGAALLLGLFTRVFAVVGLIVFGALMLARGDSFIAGTSGPLFAMTLSLALAGGGRALGLDAGLRGKVPGWLA